MKPLVVVLAGLVLCATACSSTRAHSGGITDYNPAPCPPSAAPSPLPPTQPIWSPPGAGPVVPAVISTGGTVRLRVGQRVRFREFSTVETQPSVSDLRRLTWYGDDRTFLALAPGTVTMTVLNYDRNPCCPNGPCAHPNEPFPMTVQIAADPRATLPAIPPAVHVDVERSSDPHVRLKVGQQLVLGPGVQFQGGDWGHSALLDTVFGSQIRVATRPGHAVLDLAAAPDDSGTPPRTLTLDVMP